jgi:hypothetical protein
MSQSLNGQSRRTSSGIYKHREMSLDYRYFTSNTTFKSLTDPIWRRQSPIHVDFLYLHSYVHKVSAEEQRRCNLVSHARLYAMGEKYGIPLLKEAEKRKFDEEVEIHIESDLFVEAANLDFATTPCSED